MLFQEWDCWGYGRRGRMICDFKMGRARCGCGYVKDAACEHAWTPSGKFKRPGEGGKE